MIVSGCSWFINGLLMLIKGELRVIQVCNRI